MAHSAQCSLTIFLQLPHYILYCAVRAGCYFPVEVQGDYVTQSMLDTEIAYTSVTVLYNR